MSNWATTLRVGTWFLIPIGRFVLVYFLKGSLPWQGLKARNAKRKYKIIMERKQAISIQQLCQVKVDRNVPSGLEIFLWTKFIQ